MKLNKLIVVGGLIALYTHTQLLAQMPKWTIHNSVVDYQNLSTVPLPTSPNPDYTQNGIWDANGVLKIYEADGVIYNANGGVILNMTTEATNQNFYSSPGIVAGFTEFVPVPDGIGTCDQYYGITTYSSGLYNVANPYITDVIWCIIDIGNGVGTALTLPQTGLKVAKESFNCVQRDINEKTQSNFNMHIEVSTVNSDGNRFLFASNAICVSVFNLNSSGITFIDGYQGSGGFGTNLRSEMEAYRNGEVFEVAMSDYHIGNPGGYISVFTFDMSIPTVPSINYYNAPIPAGNNPKQIVKGIEFSEDGLTLYASTISVNAGYTTLVSGDNLIYFNRPHLVSSFQYGGVIASGPGTQDFSLGMIEKGLGGKLWFVGDGRLGSLPNSNNPGGAFSANTMVISNQLTNAVGYNYSGPAGLPVASDVINRKMYLLVDQIDGENYASWTTGSDLYPSIIEVCSFPYTFPYMIPSGAITWYTGQTASNGDLLTGGTMGISYILANGCEYTETINIFLKEDLWCDAGFNWIGGTESVDPDLQVVSQCNYSDPSIIHSWELFKLDTQGNWVSLDTGAGSTYTFVNYIFANNTYKVVHHVYNTLSTCNPHFVSSQQLTV